MLQSQQFTTPCGEYRFTVSMQPNLVSSGLLVLVQLVPPCRPTGLLVASFRFALDETLEASRKMEDCQTMIVAKVLQDPQIAVKLHNCLTRQKKGGLA